MFDTVDKKILPPVTHAPAEQRAEKKTRPMFSVSERELLKSFKNNAARALPNFYESMSNAGTVSFIALWRGEDPTGQSSGTHTGGVT